MKTLLLGAGQLETGARIIKDGGLVAIPTETVYGLAANALCPDAVAKIFAAKGRPQDNPLIVHIWQTQQMEQLCRDIPDSAYKLAKAFWPGPLTMVLRKKSVVPDIVSAGLDTVAVRCPGVSREFIELCGVPLAAPSANVSKRPSPTTAQHVLSDLDGKIDAVIDGGQCEIGLESTVISLVDTPRILRPGHITKGQLEQIIGFVEDGKSTDCEKPQSPGMKYEHYAPKARLVLVAGERERSVEYMRQNVGEHGIVVCFDHEVDAFAGVRHVTYGDISDPEQLAHNMFDRLRMADDMGCEQVLMRVFFEGERYAALENRLMKAAGGRLVVL